MKITITEENADFAVVALDGRMDIDGVAEIDAALPGLSLDGRNVILDMCRVEYMASLGIRRILQMAKGASACGKKLAIANPQSLVLGVLKTANIDSVVAVCDSPEAAKRALK